MPKKITITTFEKTLEELQLDHAELLKRVQKTNTYLFFPLPPGAILQTQNEGIHAEAITFHERRNPKPFISKINLNHFKYFAADTKRLTEFSLFPEAIYDHVAYLANKVPGEAKLVIHTIKEAREVPTIGGTSVHDPWIHAVYPMKLTIPNGININIEKTLLDVSDLVKLSENENGEPTYPSTTENFLPFQPAEHTTNIIRDLNTAFDLFIIKNKSKPSEKLINNDIKDWLISTRNKPGRTGNNKEISDRVLKAAVNVIINHQKIPPFFSDNIEAEVKNRHSKKTPISLVLLDQLALYFQSPNAYKDRNFDIDTRNKGNFIADLRKHGLKGDYLRLVTIALND
jgi:hypothetical protein